MKKIISIYKSSVVEELYLYVEKSKGLKEVPEALSEKFGRKIHVSDMLLDKNKKLARADATKILESIVTKGFYLQLPPAKESYLLDLHRDTSEKYKGLD